MYTAKLINKEEKTNELIVTIEYSNGVDSFQDKMSTNGSFRTVEQLKRTVKDKIERLNDQEEISTSLVVDEDIPEPIVDEVVEKTADELAYELFIKDYRTLQMVNELISDGVLTGSEAQVVALLDKVKTDFKAEYINLL